MKTLYKPNFWIQFVSFENGFFTFRYMPFRRDWVEKNLFAERFKHLQTKYCIHCNTSHTEMQYQVADSYTTKYKHLPHNWLYDHIFDFQLALHELFGFWVLEYNVIGGKFDKLNFVPEFTSEDGWFKIKVDLRKQID